MKGKQFIKEQMDSRLPREQSDLLWEKATERLDVILKQYADLPKGVRMHTDNYIFPAAAIYLEAKEAVPADQAYAIVEESAISNSTDAGKKLAKMMKIPGMRSLFLWVWDPMTKKMFGENSGFKNVFYPKEKDAYRMDIIACPYQRYFAELGCPELTQIFCANDERSYGNLPGLEFKRSGTLETGADKCDFYMRKL